jgi:hypothetical protein
MLAGILFEEKRETVMAIEAAVLPLILDAKRPSGETSVQYLRMCLIRSVGRIVIRHPARGIAVRF